MKAITIVGGGVFAAKLCHLLATHGAIPPCEIRLAARRYDRLCLIAREGQRLVDTSGTGWTVRASRSFAEACAGASVIVLMLREGGLAARAHDESFPRAFGLTGDEGLGPGGMANALRTIPALRTIAETIARYAPNAWTLNLVAPLGVTTRFLLDAGLKVLGVCELPAVTERQLATRLSYVPLHYAGFNHLGWFWTEDKHQAHLAEAAIEVGLADAETVKQFCAVPLRYYFEMFAPRRAQGLGFQRPTSRAHDLSTISERIFEQICKGAVSIELWALRPTPWFNQALVPIVCALTGGATYRGFANVRNEASLVPVSAQAVVEVRVTISDRKVSPVRAPAPPAAVSSFLGRIAQSEDCVYKAATDQELARQGCWIASAMEAFPLPTISRPMKDLVEEIVNFRSRQ